MEYHQRDLEIAKEVGNKAGEGRSYCLLGTIHLHQRELTKAIECYQRHLEISKETGDKTGMACWPSTVITRVYSCMMTSGPVFNSTISGRFLIAIGTKVHTKVCGV